MFGYSSDYYRQSGTNRPQHTHDMTGGEGRGYGTLPQLEAAKRGTGSG